MDKNIIPVVFSTDYYYVVPTCVAIISLLENADHNTYYKIFVLVHRQEKKAIESLLQDIDRQYGNCSVVLVTVDESLFKNAVIVNGYLSVATYYRLIISDILKEYAKCIYLDGDILVRKDLHDLYQEDIGQDFIGGIKAWNMYRHSTLTEALEQELEIPIVDQYINAGVLLINLDKIRKSKLKDKFLKYVDKGFLYEDQDILNMCCYPHIKHLDAKYNTYSILYKSSEALTEFMDKPEETLKEQVLDPAIVHFSGKFIKPWENSRCRGARQWYQYLKKVDSVYNLFLEMYAPAEQGAKNNWEALLSYCRNHDSVFIWGFVERNRLLYNKLEDDRINVTGFIDNNALKQKMMYHDKKVYGLQDIMSFKNSGIVITNSRYEAEMKKQLLDEGLIDRHIYLFEKLTGWYYMGLDPAYYKQEIKDILELEHFPERSYRNMSYSEIRESIYNKKIGDDRLFFEYRFDLWLFR